MDERPRSALEMEVLEANALALGVSLDTLMENAGRAVAEEAAKHLPAPPGRVAVVAGTGNNGGDGACAAYYLEQWGFSPELWIVRDPSEIRTTTARRCFDRIARKLPVRVGVPSAAELGAFPLVLDALLGTGQGGPLRSPYAEAARAINDSGAPCLAVDLPSGLGVDGAVRPRWTVALTAPKAGMRPENSGEIVVRDIGIPERARTDLGPGQFWFFRPPSGARSARLVVIGGGPFAGAPALTALAGLRAGAERATVLCPRSVAAEVQSFSPTLVVRAVGADRLAPDDLPELVRVLDGQKFGAIALGMGAGRDSGTLEAISGLLGTLPRTLPVLVDADALEAAVGLAEPGEPRPWVLTPNAGEFLRLTRLDPGAPETARVEAARALADRTGLTLLVKGDPDLIVHRRELRRNAHHHRAASVAGVGDLLSGVTAALLAQGADPFSAAQLGAFWVGDAGRRAAERSGFGLIATDVLEEIPASLVDGLRRLAG